MSLRKAINDKCRECIYDPLCGGGNWRQQVMAYTSFKCPLFPVRPISKPKVRGEPVKSDTAPGNGQIGASVEPLSRQSGV